MDRIDNVVDRIARTAGETGLDPDQLRDIVRSELGEINCYPGEKGAGCHELALFISLKGKMGLGFTQFDMKKVFSLIIKHMKQCGDWTRHIVILTDNWSPFEFEYHREYLEGLQQKGMKIHIFLTVFPGRVTRVEW